MKKVYNWQKATVADLESDGLLNEATLIHVVSYKKHDSDTVESINGSSTGEVKDFLHWHIENNIPIVIHNGILFDVKLLSKLLDIDLSNLMVIDSLVLSWYLNPDREVHGLDSFFEDYGIKKPPVSDWKGLTYDEYKHRCQEDVKINTALWEDLSGRLVEMYTKVKTYIDKGLVGGSRMSDSEVIFLDKYKGKSSVSDYIDRILTYLMFKVDFYSNAQKLGVKCDVEKCEKLRDDLEGRLSKAKSTLESVMPPIPKYNKVNRPKKPRKKDNTLSVSGKRWNELVSKLANSELDGYGNPTVKYDKKEPNTLYVLSGYSPPNANSSTQIKDFLYKHGWKPITFAYKKDKDKMQEWADNGFKKSERPKPRAIPQISVKTDEGKTLCQSVKDLADDVPEVLEYDKYTTIGHRLGIVKGFLRDVDEDGYLKADIGGLTNTLRVKHRELVNLPGTDSPYGSDLRGVLVSEHGHVFEGSDLSSLEDRTKHHFMLPLDPEYVKTMMKDDYDPHILMALTAHMITQEDYEGFIQDKESAGPHVKKARKLGKATNYSCVYGASPNTVASSADISLAEAKILHKAYWDLNWSVKKIAEEQVVIETSNKLKWLINPINGFCYSLRSEKDRFSTLCQGTGSFFFDMWVHFCEIRMVKHYGYADMRMQFHDEFISQLPDTQEDRETMESITQSAIEDVNRVFKLRRPLGCDVQFGYRYSEIH
jgi:hypothetical protein